jgi:predicted flap endonuclease-1-like 5' DNA nuclease
MLTMAIQHETVVRTAIRHRMLWCSRTDGAAVPEHRAANWGQITVTAVDDQAMADDLAVIEGIGPKIAGVLREAGINTFAQLAATDVARLTEILQGANLRLAAPESWPEQAELAAAGDWDALKELQDRLKGGRRE